MKIRFFKSPQKYYALFPVLWKPSWMGSKQWMFEILRFRFIIDLGKQTKNAKENGTKVGA